MAKNQEKKNAMEKRRMVSVWLVTAWFVIGVPRLFADEKPGTELENLIDLGWLAYPQEGVTKQVSSFDRTGGNDDGFCGTYSCLRIDENGEYVVMESNKPGCINRIWFTDISEVGNIRFYFDGEQKPRVDLPLKEFFSGESFPFLYPLVANSKKSSGGLVSYLPMPYAKSIRVTTTRRANFYHMDYRTYPDQQGIETFDPNFSPERKEALAKALNALQGLLEQGLHPYMASYQSHPEGVLVHNDSFDDISGQSDIVLFSQEGCGIIRYLQVEADVAELVGETVQEDERFKVEREYLRMATVVAYWDTGGEQPSGRTPCIRAPLLDFFGSGFNTAGFRSLPLGKIGNTFYCAFPMPYENGAFIKIEPGNSRIKKISVQCLWEKYDQLPSRVDGMRFHAGWKKDITKAGFPYIVAEAHGRGHFVGCNMSMQGRDSIGFLEGDERIYVDGEAIPSFHGTGTEDYFNSGWYFNPRSDCLPFHGLTWKEEARAIRIAAYRYHIPDVIPFTHNIRVEIEHGGGNNVPGAVYTSCAYWYQTEPHFSFFKLFTDADSRIPKIFFRKMQGYYVAQDLADLKTKPADAVKFVDEGDISDIYEGNKQLYFEATRSGDWVSFTLPVKTPDRYMLKCFYTTGPDCGKFSLLVDDEKKLEADAYSPVISSSNVVSATLFLKGQNSLRFVIDGKNEKSGGFEFRLDYLALQSVSFVPKWMVIGPFDNTEDKKFDYVYPPETEFDLQKDYEGKGNRVKWQSAHADVGGVFYPYIPGLVNFLTAFGEAESEVDYVIAYARSVVESPRDGEFWLRLSSDNGVKVWLNNELVWRNHTHGSRPEQDSFPVCLKKGTNIILVKIDQAAYGSWNFLLRFDDPSGELRFSETSKCTPVMK